MFGLSTVFAIAAIYEVVTAHTVITYPGWRGNNLHANGTDPTDCPECRGIDYFPNGTVYFPWGMQWMYPCGGMPQTANRTFWPVSGGALSVQPGWFPGHASAFVYVNIGIQDAGSQAPPNMSHPVVKPFEIIGPDNDNYPGQFCLPQIGMPANVSLQVGQNITIQVVELAVHGASLYSCVDVTLVEDGSPQVKTVGPDNCYNSTNLNFGLVYTTTATSGALRVLSRPPLLALGVILVIFVAATMT